MKISISRRTKMWRFLSFGLWSPKEATSESGHKTKPKKDDFLFRLCGVRKVFSSGKQEIIALACQQLDIPAGEIIGIVGESGSGKSTLLHLLGAIYDPDQGQILYQSADGKISAINGDDFFPDDYRLGEIGWIFQDLNLVSHLRVWENVALPYFLRGERWGLKKKNALDLLGCFNIADKAEERPNELSGGEQQRVAICRALVNRPRVILADEPTGNLDGVNTEIVMEALRDLNRQYRISVIIVTHNLLMAREYCDQIIACRKDKNGRGNVAFYLKKEELESDDVFQVVADPDAGSKPAREKESRPAKEKETKAEPAKEKETKTKPANRTESKSVKERGGSWYEW